jgi:hypothetical protein
LISIFQTPSPGYVTNIVDIVYRFLSFFRSNFLGGMLNAENVSKKQQAARKKEKKG